MKEAAALIEKAKRFLKSAQLLLNDGDYEYTFVISEEEAEKLLQSGKDFVNNITNWLDSNS